MPQKRNPAATAAGNADVAKSVASERTDFALLAAALGWRVEVVCIGFARFLVGEGASAHQVYLTASARDDILRAITNAAAPKRARR